MKTNYAWRNECEIIDLNRLANDKDRDFLLMFGDAEIVIQYRVENARRPGHPFIDLVVAPGDPPMIADLVSEDGDSLRVGRKNEKPVAQILLGMVTGKPQYE